jgi:DNA excision repair protein ERCC-6
MSDTNRQSIDEHMTKFKGRHSCKQYLKNKPIKWGFKWWCRCCSKTGYLYEFNIYLGKKELVEFGLGESVVLKLSDKLENTYCTLFFDNFFSSPMLVAKLFDKGIYCIGTARSDRKKHA